MALFDVLSTLMGRPDPTAQLMASLGQAPGQPGGGPPVPGLPPSGQGGGGAPNSSAGAPQAGQGAPQGQGGIPPATMPNGQQAPNAFQSPSDLGQMYMAMVQRQQASNQFNNGLALMAASLYPGRHPETIINAMRGMNQPDPSETFGNLMKLQMFGQQQQNYNAMRQAVPAMLDKAGIDQSFAPLIMSNPDMLEKVVETQLGVGGGPAWMAQQRAEKALTAQGKPIPWTPGDPTSYDAWTKANTAANVTEQRTASDEKLNATSSFGKIDPTLEAAETNIEWLNDPKHRQAVYQAIRSPWLSSGIQGGYAADAPGVTGIDQDVLDARSKLDWLKKQLYADRFAGTKNVRSNTEANNLGSSATNLDTRTNSNDMIDGELQRLQNDTYAARGNLAAAAGRVVPSKYAGHVDSAFTDKNSPLYNGATLEQSDVAAPNAQPVSSPKGPSGGGAQAAPAASPPAGAVSDLRKSADPDADYEKLPSGAVFIGPDGKTRKKP